MTATVSFCDSAFRPIPSASLTNSIPTFGLSISRVDPLPHQLEAVYEYLLKLPSVRFLLADDAGAGKTIMAGLLVRELKLRGIAERILVVCPANLTFQWQRELKGKVRPAVPWSSRAAT